MKKLLLAAALLIPAPALADPPPTNEDLVREVHAYALARLPQAEPALALPGGRTPTPAALEEDRRSWGIIEID